MRNRIEHCALPSRDNLEQMAALGIIAASSVGFLHELGDSYLANLRPERMAPGVSAGRLRRASASSRPRTPTAPVTDSNPWPIIDASVNRRSLSDQVLDTAQNISLARAPSTGTRGRPPRPPSKTDCSAAWPQACADFIVLDTDPFADGVDLRKVGSSGPMSTETASSPGRGSQPPAGCCLVGAAPSAVRQCSYEHPSSGSTSSASSTPAPSRMPPRRCTSPSRR